MKFRAHLCARGRCECCGAHEHQGGSDAITNLQALYFRCNAVKRDTDTTDFLGVQASYGHREAGCVF